MMLKHTPDQWIINLILIGGLICLLQVDVQARDNSVNYSVTFSYESVKGIGKEKDICRRDPSDIIKVGDQYYIWYSRVTRQQAKPGRHGYPSGYQASIWYAVSKDKGLTWVEKGEVVPTGKQGQFDCTGVFTPNILVWQKKYYLYYTAVGPGFDNGAYADRNRTTIGLAVAESPDGPWKKISDKPIFETTRDPKKFDSYRIDDTCFIMRDGKIWMYYKGRQWKNTPGHTKMGVAVADKPAGPFKRQNGGQSVQDSGHEVMVWPWRQGVMSMVSNTGPNRMTLQYAPDGLAFIVVGKLPAQYPKASGCFRSDLTDPKTKGQGIKWGICMATYGGDPYLQRYEIQIKPKDDEAGK